MNDAFFGLYEDFEDRDIGEKIGLILGAPVIMPILFIARAFMEAFKQLISKK